MGRVSNDTEYLMVMLCKLIDALLRKDSEIDGNWGHPDFHAELREMRDSLLKTEALQKYPKTMLGI
jgi:hypothetical protein